MSNRIYPHPIIAREGWPILAGALIAVIVSWMLDLGIITFLFFVFLVFAFQFFRDPAREAPEDPRAVVSPVDGRVCKVEKCTNPETGEDAVKVSIFMNVFNVHSQKSPVAGVVEKVTYTPGLFVNADLDKASTENERSTVVIETPEGVEILTRQIAGAMARRIVTYAEVGEECYIDEHMGFIKFGSRVDVYLPLGTEICVTMGQLTTGNQTVIAKLK